MDLPKGILLKVQSTLPSRKAVGNKVIGENDVETVHFRRIGELKHALNLQTRGELRFLDEIPASVRDLLNRPDAEEIPAPSTPTGYVSRKEFEELKALIGSGGGGTSPDPKPSPLGQRNENSIFESFEIGEVDALRVPGFEVEVSLEEMMGGGGMSPTVLPYLGELSGLRVKLKPEFNTGVLQFSILQGNRFVKAYGLHGTPLEGGENGLNLDAVFSEDGLLVDEEVQFPMVPNGIIEVIWLPRNPGPDDMDPETGELDPELAGSMRAYGLAFDLNDAGGLLQYGYVEENPFNGQVNVGLRNGEVLKVKQAAHVESETGDFVMVMAGIVVAILEKREVIHT